MLSSKRDSGIGQSEECRNTRACGWILLYDNINSFFNKEN